MTQACAAAPAGRTSGHLTPQLVEWLDAHADAIDTGECDPGAVLPPLVEAGVFRWGVPAQWDGHDGTDIGDAIEAVAELGYYSMACAFVAWGHRVFIEYVLHSPNRELAQRWLPALMAGRVAGASALSNAMKFLGGIESLQITATQDGAGWRLDGAMPWVTNLRPQGFVVAAAVRAPDGRVAVVALPHDVPGLERSADLPLIGLQSSNTAAISLTATPAGADCLLHEDARAYLPGLRPSFVGIQCSLAIGLARRSLDEARRAAGRGNAPKGILAAPLEDLSARTAALADELVQGVRSGRLRQTPAALFKLRIELADAAAQAVQLELQAAGGAAYLRGRQPGFARRLRELAFVPIVTPSLVQLRAELARHEGTF
ncbi:acyl-CoA dehydrogenase family protein [Pigmentiphaga soli]|uniref:Acyl-CoA dehydrogenase family protein n=2 Tax=Pigmentiphaga soli TaxID=1007095 RepID=A0ABP8HM76_9BURK